MLIHSTALRFTTFLKLIGLWQKTVVVHVAVCQHIGKVSMKQNFDVNNVVQAYIFAHPQLHYSC